MKRESAGKHARDGYAVLFNDKNLKRWYDNVSRGSQVTADVCLRRLGHLCNNLKKTPQDLAKMKEGQLYDLLLDIVSEMEKEGRSGSYIHSQLKAVKSWLLHNRIAVTGKIKIKGVQDTPTLKDERVPTKPELRRIFVAGDEKTRVTCAFIAHAGLRPETLGHYRGNEGLRMRDLPDLSVENQKVARALVEFTVAPDLKPVPLTVIGVCTGPAVGESVIFGEGSKDVEVLCARIVNMATLPTDTAKIIVRSSAV